MTSTLNHIYTLRSRKKLKTGFLFAFLLIGLISQAQFVQVNSSCGFTLNGTPYKPLVINYGVQFMYDNANSSWYISPEQAYSANSVTCNGTCCHVIFDNSGGCDNDPANVSLSKAKLLSDMARIASYGFTEIRLSGASLLIDENGNPYYPGNITQANYFSLMDGFLNDINTVAPNLKVILGLGGFAHSRVFANNIAFRNYVSDVAAHFANNPTIMAYDLMNEPGNQLWPNNANDKFDYAKTYSEWASCIKKFDPNHLITIGFFGPDDIFCNDPTLLPIDFVSFHFHVHDSSFTLAQGEDVLNSALYWCGKTMNIPWIIGETSYSATDYPFTYLDQNGNTVTLPSPGGSGGNQLSFAQHTLQRSVDCNCKGYSWWKYQETSWGLPWEDYMGIFYRWSGSTEGGPKPVASAFPAYAGMTQNTVNCNAPSNYYSARNGLQTVVNGTVRDPSANPIRNAVVKVRDSNWNQYFTFTDSNGYFTSKTNDGSVSELVVSYPGYSNHWQSSGFTNGVNLINPILTKVNHNSWVKHWTNGGSSNLSNNWTTSGYDKYYKGDFDGDNRQDLLCVKFTSSATQNDRMVLLTHTTNSFSPELDQNGAIKCWRDNAGWELVWDNQSNPNNGGGIYPYRNNLIVGDFDGNGVDEVIGMYGGWVTWFAFQKNSGPTTSTWIWSNSNNGLINDPNNSFSSLAAYTGAVAGDYYGVGRDALLCYNSTNNWITAFQLYGNSWTWIQSNYGTSNYPAAGYKLSYLTPYIAELQSIDADGDQNHEVLGNQKNATSGTIALFDAVWSNSTNEWLWTEKWKDATNPSGMTAYKNNLIIGNFDSDNNEEVLGVYTSCRIFNFNSSYFPVPDGPAYTKIADWNIVPISNKYLFIKTDVNSNQQHLLAISSQYGNASMLSFRPNPQILNPCPTLRLQNTESHDPVVKDTLVNDANKNEDIVIYPNPNNGEFVLLFPSTVAVGSIRIEIMDAEGRNLQNVAINSDSRNSVNISMNETKKGVYFVRVINEKEIITRKIIRI